jgi:hypothetical protein
LRSRRRVPPPLVQKWAGLLGYLPLAVLRLC